MTRRKKKGPTIKELRVAAREANKLLRGGEKDEEEKAPSMPRYRAVVDARYRYRA
jgi:hypothetical protein